MLLAGATVCISIAGGVLGAALLPGGELELLFTVWPPSRKGRVPAAPNQRQAAKALGKSCL